MKTAALKLILIVAVAAAAGAAAIGWHLMSWSRSPVMVTGEVVIDYKAGTRLSSLAGELSEKGVLDDAVRFQVWVRATRRYPKFMAGLYRFEGPTTPEDVIRKITNGEIYEPVILNFTIPEGFTIRQVAERLAARSVGHIVELSNLMTNQTFIRTLNIEAPSLEGYIFPATYSFTKIPSGMQVLEHMVRTFWQKLPKDYEYAVKAKGLTLHQAVTFASLIQLETKYDDEKPLISEVIWRRLKDGAPLAIDAALIYGIPDYAGDIKWSHLSDATNPYNTRIHKGLPPTPIGAPGTAALEAVLTPSNFGYYYYVLKKGDTRHHFSKTLKEHNEHVKKLIDGTKSKEQGRNGARKKKKQN